MDRRCGFLTRTCASTQRQSHVCPFNEKSRISAFSSSSLFPQQNATEWHRFERDNLALHLAHTDAVRAGELLNALLIGRNEIRRKLGGAPEIPIAVYLAPNEAIFRELTHGRLPHWSAGVAFLESRTIVLQAGTDNLLQVARHEFAHIFLHAIAPSRVPVWFHEGVAMWASHEWRLRQSAAVFYAVFSENLIPLSEIDEVLSFPSAKADLAYTESLLAVSFLNPSGRSQCRGRHALRTGSRRTL